VLTKPAVGLLLIAQVMCFNVAGIVYASTLTLVVALLRPRNVARVAAVLALLACTYPALRMWDLFPYEPILELAADLDEDRARSQRGRFDEEKYVIDLMGDRIWFGWGNIMRIPGAEGRGEGEDAYEGGLDGYWVIEFGTLGIVGLEAYR
jgi:hypothetical protein